MTDTNLDLQEVGKRIQNRRKQLGMTQEMLAEMCNLTPQFVSYAESSKREIKIGGLQKLAKSLDVSCGFLLTGEKIDKDLLLFSNKMSQLTATELILVERLVDELLHLYHAHTD